MVKSKREVPPMLSFLLTLDVKLTQSFLKCVEKSTPTKILRTYNKVLEISCHGIPWLAALLASIWIFYSKSLFQLQINLIIGLLLDIIIIALVKATTRRRRPMPNTDIFAMGPDKYSFPSGHASRSMLVFYFFKYQWPVPTIFLILLFAWVVAVTLSRVLMKRHYIFDICAGLLIGYAEGIFMSYFYLESDTCLNVVSWLTDENVDGQYDN